MGIPGGSVVKNPPANARDARDVGLIPSQGAKILKFHTPRDQKTKT